MTAQELLLKLLEIPEEEREQLHVFTSVCEAYFEMPITDINKDIPTEDYAEFNPYMKVGQEILFLNSDA